VIDEYEFVYSHIRVQHCINGNSPTAFRVVIFLRRNAGGQNHQPAFEQKLLYRPSEVSHCNYYYNPFVERKPSIVFNAARFASNVCHHGMILISYTIFQSLTMSQGVCRVFILLQ